MKITIEQLEVLGRGCEDGRAWFIAQTDKDIVILLKAAIAGGDDTQNYANWGLTRLMNPQQRVLYACFAARQTLRNYTKAFPKDNRVLEAIKAAERWAAEPSEANKNAARSAESAAAKAAKSAESAAAKSARSAAKSRMKSKILRYGAKLLLDGVER